MDRETKILLSQGYAPSEDSKKSKFRDNALKDD